MTVRFLFPFKHMQKLVRLNPPVIFLSSFLSSLLPSPCFHSDVKRGAMRQKKNGINRRVANCSISESHDSTIFDFFI
jgi:ABC-type transport system involved in cytochrome c biogenesis permease component